MERALSLTKNPIGAATPGRLSIESTRPRLLESITRWVSCATSILASRPRPAASRIGRCKVFWLAMMGLPIALKVPTRTMLLEQRGDGGEPRIQNDLELQYCAGAANLKVFRSNSVVVFEPYGFDFRLAEEFVQFLDYRVTLDLYRKLNGATTVIVCLLLAVIMVGICRSDQWRVTAKDTRLQRGAAATMGHQARVPAVATIWAWAFIQGITELGFTLLGPNFAMGFTLLSPSFIMGFTLLGPKKVVQHMEVSFPAREYPDHAESPKMSGSAASA